MIIKSIKLSKLSIAAMIILVILISITKLQSGKAIDVQQPETTDDLSIAYDLQSNANTVRVSVTSDGNQTDTHGSASPMVSGNGRFILFESAAYNLTKGPYPYRQVFVHDVRTGLTDIVSVHSDGTPGNHESFAKGITSDGRYVLFASNAGNIVDGYGLDKCTGLFVHDRVTGQTTVEATISDCSPEWTNYTSSISDDGRYVAFESDVGNLVEGDNNNKLDVFVRDRKEGRIIRVSVDSNGNEGDMSSIDCRISADGSTVGFVTRSKLVEYDTNDLFDVYIHEMHTGKTEPVSVDSAGIIGNSGSGGWYGWDISGNGRYAVFWSNSSNFADNDTNGSGDVFLHDREDGETTIVSVNSNGDIGNFHSDSPYYSNDGRYIVFRSHATNLTVDYTDSDCIEDPPYYCSDIFLYDSYTGKIEVISLSTDGEQGNSHSYFPTVSDDGRFIAFASESDNLVENDTNNFQDIFLRDRGSDALLPTTLTSNYSSGQPGSFFELIGTYFPPLEPVMIWINDKHFGGSTYGDISGVYGIVIDTSEADEGYYFITGTSNPSATVIIKIDRNAPLRPFEGSGTIIKIPSGIAFADIIFFPIVQGP